MSTDIIVDLGIGNVGSVKSMLRKVGVEARASSEASTIASAGRLFLPGVGAFDTGMTALQRLGLVGPLTERVLEKKVPVLGICLGMQLLTQRSDEGDVRGLGWIQGQTRRFNLNSDFKVPHMGWNFVKPAESSSLFRGFEGAWRFYFVHSYQVELENDQEAEGSCEYGKSFVCAFRRENIFGVQFHPEKSHRYGMQLLKNFVEGEF